VCTSPSLSQNAPSLLPEFSFSAAASGRASKFDHPMRVVILGELACFKKAERIEGSLFGSMAGLC